MVAWFDGVADELVHYGSWATNPVPPWVARSAAVVGAGLFLGGLVAVHVSYGHAAGGLSHGGLLLVALFVPLFATGTWPWVVLGLLLLLIGAPMLGAATIRAGGLPRADGWLLAVGVPLVFAAGAVHDIVRYAGGPGDDGGIGTFVWVPVALLGLAWLATSAATASSDAYSGSSGGGST